MEQNRAAIAQIPRRRPKLRNRNPKGSQEALAAGGLVGSEEEKEEEEQQQQQQQCYCSGRTVAALLQ